MSSPALWYLTRGSGVVVLVLLTLTVLGGLVTVSRWSSPRWPRFVVEGLHSNVSLLAVVFLGVHIASAVADSYVSISWLDVFVPFGAAYKPLWLGLGALAFDCLLAVAVTSLVRVHLGYRSWRLVHWLAYGAWAFAVAHGLGIGTDRQEGWLVLINMVAVGAVLAAAVWRFSRILLPPAGPRPAVVPVKVPSRREIRRR